MYDFSKNLAWQMNHPNIEFSCNLDYDDTSIWLIPTPNEESRNLPFFVQEAGRTIAKKNYYVSRKNLDSFMIFCSISGQLEIQYNNEAFISMPNSVIWLDCRLPHIFRMTKHCEKIDGFFVHFSGSGAKTYAAYLHSLNTTGLIPLHSNDTVLTYLKKIIDLYSAPSRTTYTDLAACNYLSNLCMELIKSVHGKESGSKPPAPYLIDTKQYIEKNYIKKIVLDELAQNFFVSPTYLQKQFKQCYGCSPTDYLIQYRLSQAKVFLRTTTRSVNDIAFDVGFNNPSYFIRTFSQSEGMTPLKYRKMWAPS